MEQISEEAPQAPRSSNGAFTMLTAFADQLTQAGIKLADPQRVALDNRGTLDPERTCVWILSDAPSSLRPPPKPFQGLRNMVMAPSKRPRLCSIRIMFTGANVVFIDVHDPRCMQRIGHVLANIGLRLGLGLHETPGNGPPQEEVSPSNGS